MKLLLRVMGLVAFCCTFTPQIFGMKRSGRDARSSRQHAESGGGSSRAPQQKINYSAGAVFYAIDKENCCRILLGEERGKLSSFGGRAGPKVHPLETAIEASGREMLGLLSSPPEEFVGRFQGPYENGELLSVCDDVYTLYFIDISDIAATKAQREELVAAFAARRAGEREATAWWRAKDKILFLQLDDYFRLFKGDFAAVESELGVTFLNDFAMLSVRNKTAIKEFFCKITQKRRGHRHKKAKAAKSDE